MNIRELQTVARIAEALTILASPEKLAAALKEITDAERMTETMRQDAADARGLIASVAGAKQEHEDNGKKNRDDAAENEKVRSFNENRTTHNEEWAKDLQKLDRALQDKEIKINGDRKKVSDDARANEKRGSELNVRENALIARENTVKKYAQKVNAALLEAPQEVVNGQE